jgi:predicted  nucleic acid-binding Zn-ribbon protein
MNDPSMQGPSSAPATVPVAPAPTAKVPPKPAPKQSSGGGAAFFSLVLFAAAAGGIYYTWTNPNPELAQDLATARNQARQAADQAASLTQQAAALPAQLQALSDRIDKLEKAPPPAPVAGTPPDLGDLTKRVDDLAAKVEALASRPVETGGQPTAAPSPDLDATKQALATASQAINANKQALADLNQRVADAFGAQKTAVDQLGTRIDKLDTGTGQLDARLSKLEQGAGQIGARLGKVEAGAGVASQIQKDTTRVVRVAQVQAAIVALEEGRPLGKIDGAPPELARYATTALPTEAALRESFPALAKHARDVSVPDLSGKSFWARALTRMQQSVTVREGEDVLVGDPAAGILTDAGHHLDIGDLAGTVKTLTHLGGPAAKVMKPWEDDATALIAARTALAALAAHT